MNYMHYLLALVALLGILPTVTWLLPGHPRHLLPALSVGLLAGLGFEYESVAASRVWSVGVLGGNSVWGALSNLFVRYYL